MSKRKYKMGEVITSLDELVKQNGVYQFIRGGSNEHWKYMNIGWVVSYQLHYVDIELLRGSFRYAIKEDKDENI